MTCRRLTRRVCAARIACICIALLSVAGRLWSDDWPTYQHDTERSGATPEALPPLLTESWEFRPRHAPQPAWEPPRAVPVEGILELPRVRFDDAYHVVVAGDSVFFGSSADNKVYCLDAGTGKERWSFFTGGPVRLAPTVWKDRVYAGSDDGCVYCLAVADGRLIWKRQVGPNNRKLLGHGKMISMWPVRTGILVDNNGIAYYGAGIFPAEGVYVEAVRAEDGSLVWRNDTGGEATESRISPQGYFLATPDVLYVPMGRTVPVAYDRSTGRILQSPTFGKNIGGFYGVVANGLLYTGTEELLAYHGITKVKFAWFQARKIIVGKDTVFIATDKEMVALRPDGYAKPSLQRFSARNQKAKLTSNQAKYRKEKKTLGASIERHTLALEQVHRQRAGQTEPQRAQILKSLQEDRDRLATVEKQLVHLERQQQLLAKDVDGWSANMAASAIWRFPTECPDSLILAGSTLYAGGQDQVVAVDAATGLELWSGEVRGRARGLAVAGGRLFVSTDTGSIHAFGSSAKPSGGRAVVSQPTNPSPYPPDALTPIYEAAAEQIVRESGIRRGASFQRRGASFQRRGYCLVLGAETGRLAFELARRTELTVQAIEPDPIKVAHARQALDVAGVYGTRVSVDEGPLDPLPYSNYFANLVVSDRALVNGLEGCSAQETMRVLKPIGGVALIGLPKEAEGRASGLSAEALRAWFRRADMPAQGVQGPGVWAKVERGPLPQAGRWTHQYAEPGNTACSDDYRVTCPLGLLWFGDPGPLQMLSRHARTAGPLSVNGVLFVQGENAVMAYDAYNGVKLWERSLPKVVRTGTSQEASNLAADEGSFYVATADQCLRLNSATGAIAATYTVPKAPDATPRRWGYVAVDRGLLFGTSTTEKGRVSDTLFAIDLSTGRLRWTYSGTAIVHASLSIGDRKIFLVDQPPAEPAAGAASPPKVSPVRLVAALDTDTGRPVWRQSMDLTGCVGGSYWGTVATMYRNGALVIFGVYTDGHYWKEFFAKQFASRRIVVVSGRDGTPMWSRNIAYRVRPLIVGETLHAEPWAFDLRTGAPAQRVNPITGNQEPWQFARPGHHCGCPAASPNCMFFRSGYLGYYDLAGDSGTAHFGGQRAGCWINFIFANGLVLVPEASSGCMCPFPTMCTVVLEPTAENRAWGKYSLSGDVLPVKRLALNLGAPGDRKDSAGNLWLAYPRPTGSLVLPLKATGTLAKGGEYFRRSPDFVNVEGTPSPWLYTSGANGLAQLSVPLLGEADGVAEYTVRLGFAELEEIPPGRRVFHISLQGKSVLKDFDVIAAAGGPRRAVVKDFPGIRVTDNLDIALVPSAPTRPGAQMPVLQTVEAIREKVLALGLSAPTVEISDLTPSIETEVSLGNLRDTDLEATLEVRAPEGFAVSPEKTNLWLPSGARPSLRLRASLAGRPAPGAYPIGVRLVRPDGFVEAEKQGKIDYLGKRARVVVQCAENADVGPDGPNRPKSATLFVDGGSKRVGDEEYRTAYLKFKLDLPGRASAVRLRLWGANNPSSNGGNICQVTDPWSESSISHENRPQPAAIVGNIGAVTAGAALEVPLAVKLEGLAELSLAIVPVNCDGVDYVSRTGAKPPQLVVDCEP